MQRVQRVTASAGRWRESAAGGVGRVPERPTLHPAYPVLSRLPCTRPTLHLAAVPLSRAVATVWRRAYRVDSTVRMPGIG